MRFPSSPCGWIARLKKIATEAGANSDFTDGLRARSPLTNDGQPRFHSSQIYPGKNRYANFRITRATANFIPENM